VTRRLPTVTHVAAFDLAAAVDATTRIITDALDDNR
jgi:hypothetical protein